MTLEPAIEVKALAKTFRLGMLGQKRVDAVRGVDFRVERGQVFGFLGPNGAGKSTTIKLLAGLLTPSSGSISIFGGRPGDRATRARYGYLPEHPSFHDHLSGREILGFLAQLLDMRRPAARIEELLSLVKLANAADLPVRRYSKGMVQRLGIAQALLHDPELVIFDEPMSGLDPVGRRDVKDIILSLQRAGKTVFFSTHIIADVETLCDEVTIMLRGAIVRRGSVRDLIGRGPRQFEVRATELPPDFSGAASQRGDQAIFVVPDEDAVRALLERMWSCGGKVQDVRVVKHSLEDLFLAEIGKDAVGGVITHD